MNPYPNPYPGLRPFDEGDARNYFGRDREIDQLLEALATSRFVAVVGASGSGKSSLVRAGLLPALHGGFAPKRGASWRVAMMRPGEAPVTNLVRALAGDDVLGAGAGAGAGAASEDRRRLVVQLEAMLAHSSLGLADVAFHEGLDGSRLLVVVDQFEELFRFRSHRRDRDARSESSAFVQLLIEATRQPDVPIDVVVTMRSDFLGDCSQFRDLPEAINDGLYLVSRLTRTQLGESITRPAMAAGAAMTPRLAQRLLNDAASQLGADEVGPDPDILPVMQHVLMRTWDEWARTADVDVPIDVEHLP